MLSTFENPENHETLYYLGHSILSIDEILAKSKGYRLLNNLSRISLSLFTSTHEVQYLTRLMWAYERSIYLVYNLIIWIMKVYILTLYRKYFKTYYFTVFIKK